MGWTTTYRAKGQTHKEFFTQEYAREDGFEVLDVAAGSIDRSNVYMALRLPRGVVIGVAYLTKWSPRSAYNFGWKDMDESMGPNISDMPERIYKLLSPLEEVYPDADFEADSSPRWAKEWRQRVEAHHARMKNRPKLTTGVQVKLPYDLRTIKAGETFEVDDARRRIFKQGPYHRFKLTRSIVTDLELA